LDKTIGLKVETKIVCHAYNSTILSISLCPFPHVVHGLSCVPGPAVLIRWFSSRWYEVYQVSSFQVVSSAGPLQVCDLVDHLNRLFFISVVKDWHLHFFNRSSVDMFLANIFLVFCADIELLCPRIKRSGHIVFGLSVCLSAKTLTLAISIEW
jgi:hypothetical protein